MNSPLRSLTAAAVVAALACAPPARALVSLEDGHDHAFVNGTVDFGYDSNVFANAQSGGSMLVQGSLATEFTRRAGLISVDASASLSFARYANFRDQDYVDPKVTAEFSKQTGRTTGSLVVTAERQNRADVDVNTRDVSWNYDVGLNVLYPVIDRYSISGSFDFNHIDYQDEQLFTNLTTYTGNLYLYYIVNEERDFFVDYRSRYSEVADGSHDVDNSLSAGVSGKVFGPFNGSIQGGYTRRAIVGGGNAGDYGDFTASGTLTWTMNRQMTLSGDLARDFSTTATGQSIDSSDVGLTFKDSLSAKASATFETSAGQSRFLGPEGLISSGMTRRVDDFVSLGASFYYILNGHLKASLGYVFFRNWSTLAYAEFPRHQVNATLSTHW
ncbi:MAG TPA: hypothetical protein VGF85_08695 [Opitutaceae bacterium]|jgi:hypothetical protein